MAKSNEAALILRMEARTKTMERQMARLEKKLSGNTKQMNRSWDKGMKQMERRVKRFARNAATAFAGISVGAAAGFTVLVKNTLSYTEVLTNQAQIAGVNVERFQEMTFAASRFGIQQEKLADILKDTGDKFGDYFQTGAGPLADFFDNIAPKVGVAREAFRNLNSDQALALYVDTLERAGVNQKEMTFYMEAVASDATALIPLYRNGAKELKGYSDRARELGVVMDADLVAKGVEAKRKFDDLGDSIRGNLMNAVVEVAPQLEEMADALIESLPDIIAWVDQVTGGMDDVLFKASTFLDFFRGAGSESENTLYIKRAEAEASYLDILKQIRIEEAKPGQNLTRMRRLNAEAEKRKKTFEDLDQIYQRRFNRPKRESEKTDAVERTVSERGGDSTGFIVKPTDNTAFQEYLRQQKEGQAALAERLRAAGDLYTQTRNPMERYRASLDALNAVEGDAMLLYAAGGPETLSRARMQAIVELAQSTDDAATVYGELNAQVEAGNVSAKDAVQARKELAEIYDIEGQLISESNALRDKMIAKMDAEIERKIKLAQLASDSEAVTQLERELDLRRRIRAFEEEGMDGKSAQERAEREIAQEDVARARGVFRDAFKEGMRAAIEGDFGEFVRSKLADLASNMFDRAMERMADQVFDALAESAPELLGNLVGDTQLAVSIQTAHAAGATAVSTSISTSMLTSSTTAGTTISGAMVAAGKVVARDIALAMQGGAGEGGGDGLIGLVSSLFGGGGNSFGGGLSGSQQSSLSNAFAGFFNSGGVIPSGKIGIVGDDAFGRGGELIKAGMSPIRVMGENDTRRALANGPRGVGGTSITQHHYFRISGVDTKQAFEYAEKKSQESYAKAMRDTDRRSAARQRGFSA